MIFPIELDEVTEVILKRVMMHKKEWNDMKKRMQLSFILFLLSLALFGLYIYQTIVIPHRPSIERMMMALIDDEHTFWFAVFVGSLAWLVFFYKKKSEKAEQDFHALRCEFIQKSNELLQQRAWEKRHVLYEWMKKTYDISLYHENK
ncbi:MAG: YpbF family protein [Anoxybacillus mongoliensis]|nr:YpbF family protein [Anoxybacillus mongoliensis]